jgi:hypothetical protein
MSFNLQDAYRQTKLQSNPDDRRKAEQQYTTDKKAKNKKTEQKLEEGDK